MNTIKSKINILKTVLSLALCFSAVSCEKPAGPGGKATVKGKVYAYDWDNTQRVPLSKGRAIDERVYIVYGNTNAIGNDVRTSYDGTFEFRFLNKGHYKIFVNSLDTSIKGGFAKGNDTYIPVIKEFDITSPKQVLNLDSIVINR